MELVGNMVNHKYRNEVSTFVVVKVENSKAIFPDGSFWFADNCELLK